MKSGFGVLVLLYVGNIDVLNMKIYLEILLLVCKKLDCFCWEKYGS